MELQEILPTLRLGKKVYWESRDFQITKGLCDDLYVLNVKTGEKADFKPLENSSGFFTDSNDLVKRDKDQLDFFMDVECKVPFNAKNTLT